MSFKNTSAVEVQRFVDESIKLAQQSGSGQTPLHAACVQDRPDVVAHLLLTSSAGNLDAKDKRDQSTPMHLACRNHNVKLAAGMLHAGANAQVVDKFGKTPYDWLNSKEKKLFRELTQQPDRIPVVNGRLQCDHEVKLNLHLAAVNGAYADCASLIAAGAFVDERVEGKTPLLVACLPQPNGPEPVMPWDMESCDPFEVPSLDDAPNWQKTVQALVEGGADLMESEPIGSALHLVCYRRAFSLVHVLVKAGAHVHAPGPYQGFTPIMIAAHDGDPRVVWELIKAGARVTQSFKLEDGTVTSPIQAAALCQDLQTVALLAANGADPFKNYGNGPSAFHILNRMEDSPYLDSIKPDLKATLKAQEQVVRKLGYIYDPTQPAPQPARADVPLLSKEDVVSCLDEIGISLGMQVQAISSLILLGESVIEGKTELASCVDQVRSMITADEVRVKELRVTGGKKNNTLDQLLKASRARATLLRAIKKAIGNQDAALFETARVMEKRNKRIIKMIEAMEQSTEVMFEAKKNSDAQLTGLVALDKIVEKQGLSLKSVVTQTAQLCESSGAAPDLQVLCDRMKQMEKLSQQQYASLQWVQTKTQAQNDFVQHLQATVRDRQNDTKDIASSVHALGNCVLEQQGAIVQLAENIHQLRSAVQAVTGHTSAPAF